MTGVSRLSTRLVIATAVFCALVAVVIAVPGFITGDAQAIRDMLTLGAGLGLALLAVIMMIALPLYIVFGPALKKSENRGKLKLALAGAVAGFLLGGIVLGGFSGNLSTAVVALLTAAGAVTGWVFAPRGPLIPDDD